MSPCFQAISAFFVILTCDDSISALVKDYSAKTVHITGPRTTTFGDRVRSAGPCPRAIAINVAMNTAYMPYRLTYMIYEATIEVN